jgi:hypothetical protein
VLGALTLLAAVITRNTLSHKRFGHAYHARKNHDRGRTERIQNLHLCWF